MSKPLTDRQKAIRALLRAVDNERPHPQTQALYEAHPEGILTNEHGVPVMPVYRIVQVVLEAIKVEPEEGKG